MRRHMRILRDALPLLPVDKAKDLGHVFAGEQRLLVLLQNGRAHKQLKREASVVGLRWLGRRRGRVGLFWRLFLVCLDIDQASRLYVRG